MMSNVINFPAKNNTQQAFVTLGCGAVQDSDGTYTAMVMFSGLKSPIDAEDVAEKMLELVSDDFAAAGYEPIHDLITDFYQASYDVCEPFAAIQVPMFFVDDPLDDNETDDEDF